MKPYVHYCVTTLIKPHETSWRSWEDVQLREYENPQFDQIAANGEILYDESADIWFDIFQQRISDLAESLRVNVAIHEHTIPPGNSAPGRMPTMRDIQHSDIVATTTPDIYVMSYITSMLRSNPTMRAVIGVRDDTVLMNLSRTAGSVGIAVTEKHAEGAKTKILPRMFMSVIGEDRTIDIAAEHALRFPDIPLQNAPHDRFDISLEVHDAETTDEFQRDYLRNEETGDPPDDCITWFTPTDEQKKQH